MPELLLTTTEGLEAVAAAECGELGFPSRSITPGTLFVPVTEAMLAPSVRRLNALTRCVDRVGVLLAEADIDGLAEAEAVARRAPLGDWMPAGSSFAVRAVRRGEHEFRSPDLAGAVGAATIEAIESSRGDRPPVNLDDPDIVLRVDLRQRRLLLWLDTTGYKALHDRRWRVYTHMASMRPTVANLLLRLAGPYTALVDPFCGGGTLPIEAVLQALDVPPARLRPGGWAWQRHPELAGPLPSEAEVERAVGGDAESPLPPVFGVERFRRHLRGAHDNARRAGVWDRLRFIGGRAEQLDRVGPLDAYRGATVVTNPPFGRRVASVATIERLYRDAAAAFARAGVARVVTLAERYELMGEALESAGLTVCRRIAVRYGDTPVSAFVAEAR